MAKITTDVEKGVSVAAEDVLKAVAFINKGVAKGVDIAPTAVAALGVLLGAVSTAVTATAAASASPVTIVLDVDAWHALTAVWPDVEAFAKSIGVTL